jgi:hypothetical protein
MTDSNIPYSEPQTLSSIDNNNWHHFYIYFTYIVDDLTWEVKVPCGDINLIENYNKRREKARALRRTISAKLKKGWHPYNQKNKTRKNITDI